jgi:hypothetical protein
MRRSVVAALTLVGTAACSYIFELPETSISPTEVDASADGDAADAPPPFVAPPPPPFCETQPAPALYCYDFDDEPAPAVASLGTVDATNGQLVLSSAVASSPPRSLLASTRGTNAAAAVTHPLGLDADGFTFSFDLLVSAWGVTEATLSQIELSDGQLRCTIGLEGNASTWSVRQVCATNGVESANVLTDSTSTIVRGHWQRFAIKVAFAPTKTVSLDIDGVRALDVAGVAELKRSPISVALGAKLVPSGSLTIFQDNVLVTSP